MKLSHPVARNVLLNLVALAVLLFTLNHSTTPFATVVVGTMALVYVASRGALQFLDYAVSSKAEEDMERVSGLLKPLPENPAAPPAAPQEADSFAIRQTNFWVNLGFDAVIALIVIGALLQTFM